MVNQYKVVQSDSIEHLEELMAAKLKEGWHPHGSLSHVRYNFLDHQGFDNYEDVYSQAIIKCGRP